MVWSRLSTAINHKHIHEHTRLVCTSSIVLYCIAPYLLKGPSRPRVAFSNNGNLPNLLLRRCGHGFFIFAHTQDGNVQLTNGIHHNAANNHKPSSSGGSCRCRCRHGTWVGIVRRSTRRFIMTGGFLLGNAVIGRFGRGRGIAAGRSWHDSRMNE